MKPFQILVTILALSMGTSSLRAGTGIPTADNHPVLVYARVADTLPSVDTLVVPEAMPSIDSLLSDEALLADLRSMLDSMGIRKSFFSVDLGVGNRLFSLRNNTFNAQQVAENRVSFTPSLSYYHKSGLGISATAFMSVFDGKASFYQYAFSPSYDYLNNQKVAFGVSYAYYLTRDDLSFYATPFRHEVYGYVRGRKGWLRPGFNVGWATGSYQEVSQLDTVIFGIPRRITDTSTVGLTDLAFGFSASHHIDIDDIFKKGDGLTIIPMAMLTLGAQTYDVQSKTTVFSGTRLRYASRRYNRTDFENTGLRFQNVSFSLNASYFLDKLALSAGYFLNYFIPEADKKFTHVFSVSSGLTF
jgi:hypothetical protein